MDIAALTRKYGSTVLGTIGVVLWLVALYLLGFAAQNSAEFDRWLPWILLINISGLLTLFVLLAAKLTGLVRDYRRHVPGSRLKGRTVAIFSALAVAPILIVYYFSLQFLNRGIDSWFELEVSQGLKDTRELSHAALEVRVREFLQHTQVVAHELSPLSDFDLIGTLDRERRESTALEFTVVGAQTRIIATSSDRPMDALPVPATDEMMLQVRRGRPYVSLDTDSVGGYVIRAASPLEGNGSSGARVLIALYPVPQQLSPTCRYRTALLYAIRETGAAAPAAQIDFRIDSVLRRADVLDRGRLRRVFCRAAPGATGAGLDRRDPRGGQGQLRHQAAAPGAR